MLRFQFVDLDGTLCVRRGAARELKETCVTTASRLFVRASAIVAATLAVVSLTLPASSHAQPGYPNKPIRFIVPFGPGSGTDIMARIVGAQLAEQLKVPVVIDNREGAGGLIGAKAAADAAPDGYTILMAATPLTVGPHLQGKAPFDPVNDFTPIGKVSVLPMAIVASANAPFKTLKELIAYVKANPDKVTYASSGKGSPSHLETERIKQHFGVAVPDAPYKNVGQAMTDTIAGVVTFYFPTFPSALPHIRAGKVRGIAMGAAKRSQQAPDLPTLAEELGIPGYEAVVWYGVAAPAGLPAEITKRLSDELLTAMKTPKVREAIEKTGSETSPGDSAAFGALIRAENERWGKLVKSLNLKAD
jgi:tripartite-type tricarboxylate transporter receptor subunit TctC